MQPNDERRASFDEQAALDELERLREAIEESRRRRSERSDEFEAFVRSFRTPGAEWTPSAEGRPSATTPFPGRQNRNPQREPFPEPAAPVPAAPVSSSPPPYEAPQPDAAPAVASHVPERSEAAAIASTDPIPIALAGDARVARRQRPVRSLVPLAIVGGAIAIVFVVVFARPWRSAPTESPDTAASTATTPPPAAAAPAAPAPAPEPAPAASTGTHAMEAELIVDRRVWVRVIVDGERTIERELAPGTRIPLKADRAIVIRAGDAGALRLTMNGVDRGPLGAEGQIVTRTFTVPEDRR